MDVIVAFEMVVGFCVRSRSSTLFWFVRSTVILTNPRMATAYVGIQTSALGPNRLSHSPTFLMIASVSPTVRVLMETFQFSRILPRYDV